ncbi:MAG: hypothetical protein M0D57_08585 [Sphingobacteriales bacterium JAD_PAG50586_3]|nr:MAG: hypothetical protein M0D57_08585 [Sphingobacteriales bacterium JAD_PAG50586_3]
MKYYRINIAFALLLLILANNPSKAQTDYKADFDKIKKVYSAFTSYEVPVEFIMYDKITLNVLQKSNGTLLQSGNNRYYKSLEAEFISYDGLTVDVFHTDKTIIVSKTQGRMQLDLNPTTIITEKYIKSVNQSVKNDIKTYAMFFASGNYSKIEISFNVKSYHVNSIKIYDSAAEDLKEPVIIEIKYGKIIPKNIAKESFPITKYVTKTQAGFECKPGYVNYELMDTYTY